jgi:hypothetical protein
MKGLALKLALFLALAAAAAAACFLIKPPSSLSESGVVMKLPDKVLDFTGKEQPATEAERLLMPSDTGIVKKSYSNPGGERVDMQIVLSGIEHRSIHRPEICLRGQGWQVTSGEVVNVSLKSGHDLKLMLLNIVRPVRTPQGSTVNLSALYAYFFVSKDAVTPYHFERIATTNLDLLFKNKSHRWAYVILTGQVLQGLAPGGKDREQTLQLLEDFLREAAPSFLKSEMPQSAG